MGMAALLFLFCMGLSAQSVYSQSMGVKTLSDDGTTAVVEFAFEWKLPLQAAVDSSGITSWDPAALLRFSAGFEELSWLMNTGVPGSPQITVIASDYDEVIVPLSGRSDTGAGLLPAVEAVSPGMHRREPVVSIVAKTVQLDPLNGRLRRYRRIQARVTRLAPAMKFAGSASVASNPHLQVENSVLSTGTFFKIRITEEGIYRIDRTLLSDLGLSPGSIDPNSISIFGNDGAPVPARNNSFRIADLAENPVYSRGGGDGSFDANDVVLFYAAAPRGWAYTETGWEHYVHPFSNENVYFMRIGGAMQLPVGITPHFDAPTAVTVTSTLGRHYTDLEEFVWSREHGSGHDWMSRTIREGGSRAIFESLALPGLLAGSVQFQVRAAIASNPRATVSFESGGTSLAQLTAPSITINGAEFPSASAGEISFNQTIQAGALINLSMSLPNQTNEPEAAVDWARVFYPQALVASGDYLRFASDPAWLGEYVVQISGFSSAPVVWTLNAGDRRGPEVRQAGPAYEFRHFAGEDDAPVEYIAFTESAAKSLAPESISSVANQNLHGISSYPDLVIVTPVEFESAAERLADHRRSQGLEVFVARVEDVYNEFSGGLPDMRAIRDLFKFLYDRAPDEGSLLRYALLLGDGHYDFRGLSGVEQQEENWIFPFETEESIVTDASFTSDDYFGLLDDDEGAWIYTTFGATSNERVDIGIGRLPAQTRSEVEMMIDKIITYDDPSTFGPWRSRYVAVADDGPTGLSGTQDDADLHMQNIDQVVELIRGSLYPQIDVDKIYAESFERVFQNGYRIPGATQEVNSVLNNGALIFNYTGHGGPDGLAQEHIFTREHAETLTNGDKLAFFITATCSFGWWDLENGVSGAEVLLLNENGGAVGLFTTVRLVYTSGDTTSLNAGLNRALNIEMFREDEEGRPRRLGDVLRLTKNTGVGLQGNSRKLGLLGDPSMRIGLPENPVTVEALNGVDLDAATGQMKALDLVSLSGRVERLDGSIDATFNGTANVTVYDVVRRVPILKQVRMPTPYYRIREDLIWRGEVEVQSGRFTAQFVVPKDISYANDLGRVTVYASSAEQDALGVTENFLVGGTSENPPNDGAGPEIRLFLNDTTFVSGGIVPDSPELIVRLYDQSGVNTVGAGVGHEMLLVVDGDESNAQDISSGFQAEKNSYQKGEVRWRMAPEEVGEHSLSVRAWDVLNNSSTSDLSYIVSDDEVLTITNVYNYPNPMNRETRFVFEHNQAPGTPARVRIRIFSLNGRPIRTIDTETALPEGVLSGGMVQVPWDGRDEDFDRLGTGIYLYKLRVEVEQPDGSTEISEHVEKLAIIR